MAHHRPVLADTLAGARMATGDPTGVVGLLDQAEAALADDGRAIVADDELGAIVEDVSLGEGTTLTDGSFATCLTESMTTVRFAAPKTSGKTTVHYPFLFSPGDEPPEGPK